jgi:16S rRNA (cytosine1402-N4)-methyltransferase
MLPNVLRTNAADHVPVLADEVRELLAVQPGDTVIDATFGAGGHSRLLAGDLGGEGKLVAIDRDPTVRPYFDRLKAGTRGVQTRFLRGDYAVVLRQLASNGVRADAVLLDLGLSSMQVDRPERGFSYATDAPLDMRMDPSDEASAADVLATWSERELETIFRKYGEERYARQIARGIVRRREESPIERTGELVDAVRASIPAPARFGEGHPAKRVFQALRIEVNHELESL